MGKDRIVQVLAPACQDFEYTDWGEPVEDFVNLGEVKIDLDVVSRGVRQ